MLSFSNFVKLTEVSTSKESSAEELAASVASRQKLLIGEGVQPGDRVMIAHGGSVDFFADLFAVWGVGASALCLNQSITQNEFDNLISFAKPSAVCFADNPKLQAPDHVIEVVTSNAVANVGANTSVLTFDYPDDQEALVLFTSGTTGDPKGVVHTFGSLSARLKLNLAHIPEKNLNRSLCVLPTHFGHGLIGNCLTPLVGGNSLFLNSAQGMMGALRLGNVIDENEITFMSSVPSYWKMALKGAAPEGNSLKQVNVGSAPIGGGLLIDVASWSGCGDIRNMYGITETANWISGSDGCPEIADGYVGKPWGGDVAIWLDGDYRTVGEGELCVKSDALMQGYLNRPDLTAEVLKNSYFHTGDKGQIDPSGAITLTGRLKNEINRAGMKISPEEIDLLLERHEAIDEVCCFGLEDEVSGEIVAVAIKLAEHMVMDDMMLRKWCGEFIRPECIPERVFYLDEIPKTDRGKINRQNVKKVCLS